jgi:hypothetical protein
MRGGRRQGNRHQIGDRRLGLRRLARRTWSLVFEHSRQTRLRRIALVNLFGQAAIGSIAVVRGHVISPG